MALPDHRLDVVLKEHGGTTGGSRRKIDARIQKVADQLRRNIALAQHVVRRLARMSVDSIFFNQIGSVETKVHSARSAIEWTPKLFECRCGESVKQVRWQYSGWLVALVPGNLSSKCQICHSDAHDLSPSAYGRSRIFPPLSTG